MLAGSHIRKRIVYLRDIQKLNIASNLSLSGRRITTSTVRYGYQTYKAKGASCRTGEVFGAAAVAGGAMADMPGDIQESSTL